MGCKQYVNIDWYTKTRLNSLTLRFDDGFGPAATSRASRASLVESNCFCCCSVSPFVLASLVVVEVAGSAPLKLVPVVMKRSGSESEGCSKHR